MNQFKSLLYSLSMTDKEVIKDCTDYAKLTQLSLGFFVLLTGLVAYITMVYMLNLIFGNIYLSLACSVIYAGFIVLIDRMVVSSRGQIGVIPRLLLALLVAYSVAIPLELALFENQISALADEKLKESNNVLYAGIQDVNNELITHDQVCLEDIRADRDREVELSRIISSELLGYATDNTTGRAGRGPVAIRREAELEELKSTIRAKQEDCERVKSTILSKKSDLESRVSTIATRGFLADYVTLQELRERDKNVDAFAWGVMLFILFIEVTPAIMKLTLMKTDYDHKLESRINKEISDARKMFPGDLNDDAEEGIDESWRDYKRHYSDSSSIEGLKASGNDKKKSIRLSDKFKEGWGG